MENQEKEVNQNYISILLSKIEYSVKEAMSMVYLKSKHPNYKYWKEAFDIYNSKNKNKLGMGCVPCYAKVYVYLKNERTK